jgi:WD40 repeat protein
LLATLHGHTSAVWGMALEAGGRLLASGSEDGTVRLWELPGGRALATLQGHTSGVYSVALAAAGHLVASASADGTVRLWQAAFASREGNDPQAGGPEDFSQAPAAPPSEWRPLATLWGHTGVVRGVALSADGHLVASGGFDETVRLWESSSAACLRVLRSARRYERVDITGLKGITAAQRQALIALGAVDQSAAQIEPISQASSWRSSASPPRANNSTPRLSARDG